MAEELKIKLSADTTDLKKGVADADATLEKFRVEQQVASKTKLQIDVLDFSLSLKKAQKELKEAIKTGDREAQIKLTLDIADLKSKSTTAKKAIKDIEKSMDEGAYKRMSRTLAGLRTSYKDLEVSGQGASKSAKDMQKEITRLDTILKKADAGAGQFQRNVGNYPGVIGKAKESLTGLKNELLALGAGFLGIQGGIGVLKASMNFERQVAQFEVLFGGVEEGKKILDELNEFALRTPFDVTNLRDSAIQLKAYGFQAKEIIPTMQKLGDLSLGDSQKFERLAYALGQVKSAGKLYGSELRQFTETGIPLLDALGEKHGKTAAEMRDMVTAGKVGYQDVIDAMGNLTAEGGLFYDSMAKQSDTLGGKWERLKEAWTLLQEKFKDTAAYESLKKGIDAVTDALPKIFKAIGFVITAIGNLYKAAVKLVKFLTQDAVGIMITLVASIGGVAFALKNLSLSFAFLKGGSIITAITTMATSFWGLAAGIAGVSAATFTLSAALVATGIGAIVVGLGVAIAKLGADARALRASIGELQTEIDAFSASGFEKEAERMQDATDKMKGAIGTFWDDDEDFATGVEQYIQQLEKINKETGAAEQDYRKTIERIGIDNEEAVISYLDSSSFLANTVAKNFREFSQETSDTFKDLQQAQSELTFQEMIDEVQRTTKLNKTQFDAWLQDMSDTALEGGNLAEAINFGISAGMSNAQGLEMIRAAGGQVTDEVYNSLVPSMQDTINTTLDMQEQGVNNIGQLIKPAYNKGAAVMKSVNDGLNSKLPTLAAILNRALSGLKKFVGSVGDKFPQLDGFIKKGASLISKINIPKIGVDVDGAGNALVQIERVSANAKKSAGSINSLNEELSGLQEQYKKADIGSEEFKRLGSAIKETENKLKSAKGETKSTGTASRKASVSSAEAKKAEAEEIRRASEELKAQKKEQEKYGKSVEEVEKTFEELSKATSDYYDELESNIKNAQKSQEELTKSLDDYKKEQRNDVTADLAERDITLSEEKITTQKEITELETKTYQDGDTEQQKEDAETLLDLKQKLLDIEKERATISEFVATQGTQEQFTATQNFQGLSDTEQAIATFEAKKSEKEKEVQLELDKQKRIEEINQKILDSSLSTDRQIRSARNRLEIQSQKGRLADEEIINESLKTLGFENLTDEEELMVVKKLSLGESLNDELKQVSNTQRLIMEEKQKYFELTEKIYSDSIDVQKAKTQELISQINGAIQAQQKLNALKGTAKTSDSIVNNTNTTNNNITQNISSQSEADYFASAVQKSK